MRVQSQWGPFQVPLMRARESLMLRLHFHYLEFAINTILAPSDTESNGVNRTDSLQRPCLRLKTPFVMK